MPSSESRYVRVHDYHPTRCGQRAKVYAEGGGVLTLFFNDGQFEGVLAQDVAPSADQTTPIRPVRQPSPRQEAAAASCVYAVVPRQALCTRRDHYGTETLVVHGSHPGLTREDAERAFLSEPVGSACMLECARFLVDGWREVRTSYIPQQ